MDNEFVVNRIYFGPEHIYYRSHDDTDRVLMMYGSIVGHVKNHCFNDGAWHYANPYWIGTIDILPPEIA